MTTGDGNGSRTVVLVTGAHGFIGTRLVARLAERPDTTVVRLARRFSAEVVLDLDDPHAVTAAITALRPTHIVHTAAIAVLSECERDPEAAERVNGIAAEAIARAAASVGARMIHFSTDQVFAGEEAPYREADQPNPRHVYGRTKAAAEARILSVLKNVVILRTALVFGRSASGVRSPDEAILAAAREGRRLDLFTDEYRTPVAVRWIAEAVTELLESPFCGILNASGPERVSRAEFGLLVCRAHGLDPTSVIRPIRRADQALVPPRPRDLSLDISLSRAVVRAEHASLFTELLRNAQSLA